METLAFKFVVGTDFHHHLFAFGFDGAGRTPGRVGVVVDG